MTVWGDLRGVMFGQMYEDHAIEQAAFRGRGRVFVIASAGCTAYALAREHDVVACDINAAQLAYARRRWERPAPGAAEHVMNAVRWFGPLAGWRRAALQEFLALSISDEQIRYWRRHLNTRLFRTAFDALLWPPRALTGFLPDRFGAVVRARLERGFSRHANASNPWARALLLGELAPLPPPPREITWVRSDAAEYLERCPPASIEGFALSNILDGAEDAYAARLARAVQRAAAPGAMAVWRSFVEGSAENRAADDRAMIWGSVIVQPAGAALWSL